MLDVQQIFGRAGRPQFQDSGEGEATCSARTRHPLRVGWRPGAAALTPLRLPHPFLMRPGIIITTHDKLAHYLGMLTHRVPIESQFTQAGCAAVLLRRRHPCTPVSCSTRPAWAHLATSLLLCRAWWTISTPRLCWAR